MHARITTSSAWTLSRDPELVVIRARMSDLLCVYEYCK